MSYAPELVLSTANGMFMYFYFAAELAVNIQQKNTDHITHAIYDRPKGIPLITVSNHTSCIDDPLIWGERVCVLAVNLEYSLCAVFV